MAVETDDERLARWHRCVMERDMDGLREFLAEDVQFRSPVFWKPKQGREAAMEILGTVIDVFEDFRYHREGLRDDAWALEFSAHVGDTQLKGMDLIQFDDRGRIVDFEVLIRPANALQAVGQEMARRLGG